MADEKQEDAPSLQFDIDAVLRQAMIEDPPQMVYTPPADDLSTIGNDTIGGTVKPWDVDFIVNNNNNNSGTPRRSNRVHPTNTTNEGPGSPDNKDDPTNANEVDGGGNNQRSKKIYMAFLILGPILIASICGLAIGLSRLRKDSSTEARGVSSLPPTTQGPGVPIQAPIQAPTSEDRAPTPTMDSTPSEDMPTTVSSGSPLEPTTSIPVSPTPGETPTGNVGLESTPAPMDGSPSEEMPTGTTITTAPVALPISQPTIMAPIQPNTSRPAAATPTNVPIISPNTNPPTQSTPISSPTTPTVLLSLPPAPMSPTSPPMPTVPISSPTDPLVLPTLPPLTRLCYDQELWDGVPITQWRALQDARENLLTLLASRSYDSLELLWGNVDNPQYRAYEWVACDPKYFEYGADRVLQRWVLSVFAFGLSSYNDSAEEETRVPEVLNSWSTETDECSWFSSRSTPVCNADGLYERIDIRDTSLFGTLPSELSLLSNSLKWIFLRGNNIYGSIPTEFGELSLLERFQMSFNLLEGSIPTETGLWNNLVAFGVGRNYLNGKLPSELGNMLAVDTLGLERNSFTGTIPSELGSLEKLELLYLDRNLLTGTVPETLVGLENLRVLNVGFTELVGAMPVGLCERESLKLIADCAELECQCCEECTTG